MARGMAPNLPIPIPVGDGEWTSFTWGGQSIARALSGEVDRYGNQYDVGQATLRAFGVKVKPFDAEKEALYRHYEREGKVREWKKKMSDLSRRYSRKNISEGSYKRQMREASEQIKAIYEEK